MNLEVGRTYNLQVGPIEVCTFENFINKVPREKIDLAPRYYIPRPALSYAAHIMDTPSFNGPQGTFRIKICGSLGFDRVLNVITKCSRFIRFKKDWVVEEMLEELGISCLVKFGTPNCLFLIPEFNLLVMSSPEYFVIHESERGKSFVCLYPGKSTFTQIQFDKRLNLP